jgi:hypothetical protein
VLLTFLQRVEHRPDQAGLADAGLADQQHRLALAGCGLPPALEHKRELLVAPDHGQRPTGVPGLKAAVCGVLAEDPERRYRGGEALQPGRVERAQAEYLAEQPARAVRYHHGAGLSYLLQPGGEVGRLADYSLLLGSTLTDEVAHDHKAGCDPDPNRERLPGRGGEPGDGLSDR